MLTTASELVGLLTRIEDVCVHPSLSDDEKVIILTEMRSEIPADRLCRFSPKTLAIVKDKMEKAIHVREKAKSKSPTKNRTKASPESSKA